ncbi:MAG: DoxX family membrane protein [Myxococcota bacterium]|nr:DoxX family membrane protein [Myxococcota bacterium]
MLDDSNWPRHPLITLAGRFCFTLIFFISGITHFTDVDGYAALMPEGVPWKTFWVLISGAVELAGATMILSNRSSRLGAWLLILFLVPVTLVVHGVAAVAAETEMMQAIQSSFFLKGVAMTGAALLISQSGAGHPSKGPIVD